MQEKIKKKSTVVHTMKRKVSQQKGEGGGEKSILGQNGGRLVHCGFAKKGGPLQVKDNPTEGGGLLSSGSQKGNSQSYGRTTRQRGNPIPFKQ